MTVSEFLHMGGYAFYVWTSYALAFVVLVANLILPIHQRRHLLSDIARKARRYRARSVETDNQGA